jgi:outer membrane protein TolC
MRTILVALLVLVVAARADAQERTAPGSEARSPLASLVAELEQRNPELAAARREIDMRVARIAPAGAPPDPTVSVGYMSGFLRPPFFPSAATPDAWRQVGVSQELPYPGKLALRSRVAATEADLSRWTYEDARVRLIADLKMAYADYVLVTRTLEIVEQNKTALEQFRGIAEARFAVGKASQQDVLRAQLELSILLERVASLQRDRTALEAEINRLVYRSPGTPVPVGDPIDTPPTGSLENLQERAARHYPALKRDEQRITRGQQALALAKREQLPDFGISFTTQKYVGRMPWMYGIDFMVKVPIFFQRKQRPLVAEAAASLEAANRMREGTLSDAAARVAQEYAAMTTSQRLMDLYGDSVLPLARLALESSTASYEVGSVDFLTLLTNFITVLNYEVSFEEQRARYRQALARLESLVGADFIR